MRLSLALVPVASLVLSLGSVAHADTISAGAAGPITVDPNANTTVQVSATKNEDIVVGSTFHQLVDLISGKSQSAGGQIQFSFTDNFTDAGVTTPYTVAGFFDPSNMPDSTTYHGNITFNQGPSVLVGSVYLSMELLTFQDTAPYPGGDIEEIFNFDATAAPKAPPTGATPEPSSLILLGTGLVGLAGAARRKLAR